MRHQRLRRKLGVNTAHRRALLRNLVKSLVISKRIRTTLARAKEAGAFADQMITLAKRGDLHARRLLEARLASKDAARVLMKDIAPHFKERRGGYTRVLRLTNRPGDNSVMALLEFTEKIAVSEPEKKPKKAKKTPKPKTAKKEAETEQPAAKPDSEKKSEKPREDKKESEKRGGFLGSLRKFLKGED